MPPIEATCAQCKTGRPIRDSYWHLSNFAERYAFCSLSCVFLWLAARLKVKFEVEVKEP